MGQVIPAQPPPPGIGYGVAAPHIYESDGEGRLVAHAISTNLHLRRKKNSAQGRPWHRRTIPVQAVIAVFASRVYYFFNLC